MKPASDNIIFSGYAPGALGRVCSLQASYYAREWELGRAFETCVASEMAAFFDRFDTDRDLFIVASNDDEIVGSITMDGSGSSDRSAHLRWFIVSDAARGHGLGRALIDRALGFARGHGFMRVYLWTFEGLMASRRLYDSVGFELVDSRPGSTWGREVNEQRFELRI